MTQPSRLAEDLRFVRRVVDPRRRPHLPRTTLLIWAAVVLVGFPLPDFVGQKAVLGYWVFAGPAAFLACGWASARAMRRAGEEDVRLGRQQLAHWGVFLVVGSLAVLMPSTGTIDWSSLAPVILLLVAFAYLLAGVHLDACLAAPGLAFAIGYCLLLYRVAFAWTAMGILAALALVLTAELGRSRLADRAVAG